MFTSIYKLFKGLISS